MSANDAFLKREAIFFKIESAIIEHFGHWETSLVSIDKLEQYTRSYIERAADIKNDIDFTLLLMEYLNGFNNVHTLMKS